LIRPGSWSPVGKTNCLPSAGPCLHFPGNKQLNFLQHIFTILKQHGRAAVEQFAMIAEDLK